jgi:hypothetical protein
VIWYEQIKQIIDNNPELTQKLEILLKAIPGIGNIVAFELLILLPELIIPASLLNDLYSINQDKD